MERPIAAPGLPTPAFAPAAPSSGLLFDDYLDNLFEPAPGLDGGYSPTEESHAAAPARPPAAGAARSGAGRGRGGGAAASARAPQRKASKAVSAIAAAEALDDDGFEDGQGEDDDDDDDDDEDDGDGDGSGGGGAGSKRVRSADPEQRKARSRERNRLHARKSRLRKKFFVDGLRSSVDALEAENQRLRAFAAGKLGLSSAQFEEELGKAFAEGKEKPGEGSSRGSRAGRPTSAAAAAPPPPAPAAATDSVLAAPGTRPTAVIENSDFVLMQALTKAQHNFVVSDPSLPDNPIVFASAGFYELTGYLPSEVVGRNCRFLQGPETDPAAIAIISKGLREGKDTVVCLLNYRKDGSKFYNRFFVAPLRGIDDQIVNFVGVQCEVQEAVARGLIAKQREAAARAQAASVAAYKAAEDEVS